MLSNSDAYERKRQLAKERQAKWRSRQSQATLDRLREENRQRSSEHRREAQSGLRFAEIEQSENHNRRDIETNEERKKRLARERQSRWRAKRSATSEHEPIAEATESQMLEPHNCGALNGFCSFCRASHITSEQPNDELSGNLRISSGSLVPETTTFTLEQELLMDLHKLSDKIQKFYPAVTGREFTLCFQGDDGDKCEYVFTSASAASRNGSRHNSIRCKECRAEIVGFRYKCVSCADYDLCSACEALGAHSHHIMMRIAKPIKFKQAQTLLQRWCDAMKAAGVASVEDITGEPAAAGGGVGGTSGGNGVAGDREILSTDRTDNSRRTPETAHGPKRNSRSLLRYANASPRVQVAGAREGGRTDGGRPAVQMSSGEAAITMDPLAPGSMPAEAEASVKVEPQAYSAVTDYNTTFIKIEPTFTVEVEEVKEEALDPFDTEGIVKVEADADYQETTLRSWGAGGTSAAATVARHPPGLSHRDTHYAPKTFAHKTTKKS